MPLPDLLLWVSPFHVDSNMMQWASPKDLLSLLIMLNGGGERIAGRLVVKQIKNEI
jgi:hypothetical protein